MCLEEAAAAEGEQRGGTDATFQLLSKLSSGHEGDMKEESEQCNVDPTRPDTLLAVKQPRRSGVYEVQTSELAQFRDTMSPQQCERDTAGGRRGLRNKGLNTEPSS